MQVDGGPSGEKGDVKAEWKKQEYILTTRHSKVRYETCYESSLLFQENYTQKSLELLTSQLLWTYSFVCESYRDITEYNLTSTINMD